MHRDLRLAILREFDISVRPGNVSLCHNLSKEHTGYSRSETDSQIHQALDASGPHTCKYIRKNGFACAQNCGVEASATLVMQYPQSRNKEQNGAPGNEESKRITISIG